MTSGVDDTANKAVSKFKVSK